MDDITIVFLTLNKVPEKWARYHKKVLMEAIGNTPLITISKKPLKWGVNLIQKSEGHLNIYKQMLRGANLAKTPYVAVAEDDTLYPKEHFTTFRPPMDTFAYNSNRWGIFTWGHPRFFLKQREANATLIAPRELMVEALEERFKKGMTDNLCGELGSIRTEHRLGVTPRKHIMFTGPTPVLSFSHSSGLDPLERAHRKRMWPIQALEIPNWGRSCDIVKKFA